MTTIPIPFNQRFGVGLPPVPLDKEVPDSARIGLLNILRALCEDRSYIGWPTLSTAALYAARREKADFHCPPEEILNRLVKTMEWHQLYSFCERAYTQLHGEQLWDERGNPEGYGPVEEAQRYFSDELNLLLGEEGLAYQFVAGQFQRRGRPQTQKNLQRVGSVLFDPRYAPARQHFNKALAFFNLRPEPDSENCVKEALCAMEAFTEILFGDKAAKGFEKTLRTKQGNAEDQIPPALVESMLKLRAYRGDAKGVAHAHLEGGAVTPIEAELALSLAAACITYLHDKSGYWLDTIPF